MELKHDDEVGEHIEDAEAQSVLEIVCKAAFPYVEHPKLEFPGSQPVSLARSNIDLLQVCAPKPPGAGASHTRLLP